MVISGKGKGIGNTVLAVQALIVSVVVSFFCFVANRTDKFDRVTGQIESSELPDWFLDTYHDVVRGLLKPASAGDFLFASTFFLGIMTFICCFIEALNPSAFVGGERLRIMKSEFLYMLPSGLMAPAIALGLLAYAYPEIHGHEAPLMPESLGRFGVEAITWYSCFEFFSYWNHRMIHHPLFYSWVHKQHHTFEGYTAFSAHSISIPESILQTTMESMCFLLFPISVFSNAVLGLILFTWSAAIHDSECVFRGDWAGAGFHLEHHANPNLNFSFLGVMDTICGTLYWGQAPAKGCGDTYREAVAKLGHLGDWHGTSWKKYTERIDVFTNIFTPWRVERAPPRLGQRQIWLPVMLATTVMAWSACAWLAYTLVSAYGWYAVAVGAVGTWYCKLPPRQIKGAPEVVIVGFGFSGMDMALQLKKRGVPFKVYEKASNLGGVWHANKYPGVACDSYAHTYNFSYELASTWTKSFPEGHEIHGYLERLARKHGLLEHVHFNTELVKAEWKDDKKQWRYEVKSKGGATSTEWTQVLLSAVGVFHKPKLPDMPTSAFQGDVLHTSMWDPSYDPTGKTIAVMGTGASAIQLIPQLAMKAKHLYVFQRTPSWILPKTDYDHPAWLRFLFENVPLLLRMHRYCLFMQIEIFMYFFFAVNENKDGWCPKAFQGWMTSLMRWQVSGLPQEWQKGLVPDYLPGCKRVVLSAAYLQTFYRDNVTLVPQAIKKVERTGVVAADGTRFALDSLACATGFDMLNHPTAKVIIGRDGAKLSDFFDKKPLLYRGMEGHGFPNFMALFGPGSLHGFSGPMQIERQTGYVLRMLEKMANEGLETVEVTRKAHLDYYEYAQKRLQNTVLGASCSSYYRNKEGVIWSHIPGTSIENFFVMRTLNKEDYATFPSSTRQPSVTGRR